MAIGVMESFRTLVSSFFGKKESLMTATAIDIGASSIKLVQLSLKNGRIILNTYGSIALGPYANLPVGAVANPPVEKMGEAIKELLKECEASTVRIAVSLPAGSSLFRDIEVPGAINDEEMKTVALTEARKVIPVPVQDVEIDWLPIPIDILPEEIKGLDKKHLLLVAVSKESQKRVDSYMTSAGIIPIMYELETFSSMRSVYTHERAPIAIIDLGASHVKISIIHEGSMRRSLSLERGFNELNTVLVNKGISFEESRKVKHAADITSPGENETLLRETYTSILKDVQNVISEYERYSHSSISRAVLIGGGAEMKGITSFTESILGVPTEKSHPFSRTSVPDLVKDIVPQIEPEFTIATGLALRLLAV